jgi:FkbM family methyltransferase
MSGEAIEAVKSVIDKSPCKSVTYVNKGAWHTKGEIEIIEGETPATTRIDTGRLHPGSMDEQRVTKVFPVDTIENICQENGIDEADYMEITVNGAEVDAIRGMGTMLQRTKRVWVAGLTRDEDTGEPLNKEISDLLQSHGFKTKISKAMKSSGSSWGMLDGHVYGWRA